jgi:hypothetical protein
MKVDARENLGPPEQRETFEDTRMQRVICLMDHREPVGLAAIGIDDRAVVPGKPTSGRRAAQAAGSSRRHLPLASTKAHTNLGLSSTMTGLKRDVAYSEGPNTVEKMSTRCRIRDQLDRLSSQLQ